MRWGGPSKSVHLTSSEYAGAAVVYGLLLTTMAFFLAGGGHGVIFFLRVSLSGMLFWPVAGAAIPWAHRPVGKAIFLVTMSSHYLLATVIVSWSDEGGYLSHVWVVARGLVITYVATYLVGQMGLWWAFVSRATDLRRLKRSR